MQAPESIAQISKRSKEEDVSSAPQPAQKRARKSDVAPVEAGTSVEAQPLPQRVPRVRERKKALEVSSAPGPSVVSRMSELHPGPSGEPMVTEDMETEVFLVSSCPSEGLEATEAMETEVSSVPPCPGEGLGVTETTETSVLEEDSRQS